MDTPPLDRDGNRRLAIIRHVEEVTGNVAATCRYFGITRQAYYLMLHRYEAEGIEDLRTRSKRPKTSPNASYRVLVKAIQRMSRASLRLVAVGRGRSGSD
jgi:transposase-like protein